MRSPLSVSRHSHRAIALAAVPVLIGVAATSAGTASAGTEAARPSQAGGWVTTWSGSAMSPTPLASSVQSLDDQTVRDIVYTSAGGDAVRIRVTNAFGDAPLTVRSATVARQLRGADLDPATTHRLTFGGGPSVVVPKGGSVLSDPIRMPVPALSSLAVSLYAPGSVAQATYHQYSQTTNYLASGDHAADADGTAFATTVSTWFLLDAVQVRSHARGTIVAVGDSITEVQQQRDDNSRWPNFLARSLAARYGTKAPAVANEGISGNRVLSPSSCYGAALVTRLDRDVFSQPGVRDAVLLEGVNDLGFSQEPDTGCFTPNTDVTPQDLIGAYQRIAAAAHAHGVRILIGTLTPAEGYSYWSATAEGKRQAVNAWIRGNHVYDGVIDFDASMRYPGHPELLDPRYDSGDHLHPNAAGRQAMADAVEHALGR
ncbi:SGNH/GDSL hydrolase family protein [Actinoallomurus acaciae]|uniref:SGNH/GDSL hydrolase family protein n=1 Tax=Actinoallomurus acaciae TaxID=502577 RepID=A0ABV5YTF8_9ACTN